MAGAPEIAASLARHYPTPFLRHYTYWKVRTDPLYPTVWELLSAAPTQLPVLDLGCGAGQLAFYLRAHGYTAPIVAIDADAVKIKVAQDIADLHPPAPRFIAADYRDLPPQSPGHVTLLDVLQYIPRTEQIQLITSLAPHIAADGGTLIIRNTLLDQTWRSRVSLVADHFARWVRWMGSPPLEYPDRQELADTLSDIGLNAKFQPLWGATPFNNYLIVATRK
ncbi:MAG: class I SAM-dependent methyltransferase [Verrucomicrobiales bacterium]|nr:class I SAM-dependent methyltransferase [Verrucomicrobiales bacterium]MCP5557989.1 class I SAM-dependent methyltransferase [Verrucomicrobiaceae bacterium]